jgi:4'-phosphopantetheinyl transferase
VVALWRIPLAGAVADTVMADTRLLDAGETARARRLPPGPDRHRWTAARGALRLVLARCTGTAPDRISFTLGRYGKPRPAGAGPGGLCFSLSHSRDLALLAVCRGTPVGVDLEHLSAGPAGREELDDLASAVLTPEEWQAYLRLPHARRRAALLRRWTGKEAVLKATGQGVTAAALRRVVVPEGDGPVRGLPGRPWRLLRVDPDDAWSAALAVRDPAPRVDVHDFVP